MKVKPKIVVEINYEEIQKSPTSSSGWSTRFPRCLRLREDKSVKEISTIEDVKRIHDLQKKK